MRTCLLQTHSSVNDDLFRLTLPNHAEYADAHKYDMIQLHRTYKEIWWGTEDYVLALLPNYDRILQVGSDVIFTDIGRPLDVFDDGEHSVFIQDEGAGYPTVNFDVVLWTKAEGVRTVIEQLRQTRADYEHHRFGLQTGMTLLTKDPHMQSLIKVMPPRSLQSGDFSLHFFGYSNEDKVVGCERFLHRGQLMLRRRAPVVG